MSITSRFMLDASTRFKSFKPEFENMLEFPVGVQTTQTQMGTTNVDLRLEDLKLLKSKFL